VIAVGVQRRLGVRKVGADTGAWLVVGALASVRILLSFYRLSLPGLQYDETLFVNAATLRVPGDYISHSIHHFLFLHSLHGIPLMVYPYIGALKSWIYAPVFSLFGESAISIRLPAELIATAGLLLVYPALRDLINRPVALLAFAALCFDNSLFWLTRDDVGPTAIELFMKCAGLYCVARYARTGSVRWVVLLLITLGLGVFNKLNYVWVVDASVLASVVTAFALRDELSARRTAVIVWVLGLVVLYGCFIAYYIHNHISQLEGGGVSLSVLPYTWPRYLAGIKLVLSGVWFYDYALQSTGPRMVFVWLVVILFVVGALASLLPRSRNLPVAVLGLVTLVMSAQTLATYQATAGWHYVSVYPYVTIVAAYGVWVLATVILRRRRGYVLVAMAAALVGALAYDGVLMAKYDRQLQQEPTFSAWTPAIYALSSYLQTRPGDVLTADWGILNPLFALNPSERYVALEFELEGGAAGAAAAASQAASLPGPKVVVTHVADKQVFAGNDARLRQALRGHLRLLRVVDGDANTPIYDVYAYH
jgi:4-amino-4-deoxy-L-arabinose transferase-like glycosyltransferase